MTKRVALVLVSHSRLIAEGTKELAAQMAPDVHIGVSGGNPNGGLGTSFDAVQMVTGEALRSSKGAGVVLVSDLGSAAMTVDTIIEFSDDPDLLRHAPGPFVEGAIAAAVSAQNGGSLGEVVGAVTEAARLMCSGLPEEEPDALQEGAVTRTAVIADAAGLHARPAAKLAALAATFDSDIQVGGANAKSALAVMALALPAGREVEVTASGPDAKAAADALADAITAGFDVAGVVNEQDN